MTIPILIICYNNYKYVQNTLEQILKINKKYYDNTIILNNASTCLDTIEFLKNTDVTIIENANNGPWISSLANGHIYDSLPDKYVLTDPDLQFNENLPSNFIEILCELSDKYQAGKVGFALDISDHDKMYEGIYAYNKSIYKWEIQFWEKPLYDNNYDIYVGGIDTTFAVVNKKYEEPFFNLRVAGDFTAKHLPWYKCNEKIKDLVYNVYENYEICNKTTEMSTTKSLILSFIEENYIKVFKNDETFLIENTNPNLHFWIDTYNNWKSDTFTIFDNYLKKNKVFIDIGSFKTTMYGSRKSKHVYSIETDTQLFAEMQINLQTNCIQNYTLIHEIVGLESIIQNYQIEPNTIGLIKVDIQGREENILNDLIYIQKTYNIPLYICFDYNSWVDNDLDRFNLSLENKNKIVADPFISILFFE